MKIYKKILAIVLTLAMTITIAPTFSTLKAGEGMNIKSITNGINSDGTVSFGKPITIKMSDMLNVDEIEKEGFENRIKNGSACLKAVAHKTYGDFSSKVSETKFKYKDGTLTFVPRGKDIGYYYVIHVDDPQGANANDSNWYKEKGSTINFPSKTKIGSVYASKTILKRNFTVYLDGEMTYTVDSDSTIYPVDQIIVKLYKNGQLVGTKTTESNQAVFNNVPVSYGKKDTIKVALFINIGDEIITGDSDTYNVTSGKLPNVKVIATKISNKKSYLRWGFATGASGYYIYMGKKRVKKVGAKTTKTMITKKKAGKGKFRVVPYVKVGKTEYKSSSNTAKPKKNQHKWSVNKKVKTYTYATCKFVISKVSLKGKTYTVTGYAMNNRMWDFKKYKSLKISLWVDGKKAFSKKYKNKKIKIKEYKKKKIVLKIKGKAGKDLVYGNPYFVVNEDPDWGLKNDIFKD